MEEAVILRALERILAVFIGGMAIYLGFLLFSRIPSRRESEGKIEFPGHLSVYVARVGPGVFFALFGAIVVGISFYQGIIVTTQKNHPDDPNKKEVVYAGFAPQKEPNTPTRLADERLKLRHQVELLNRLPSILRGDISESERREIIAGVLETKLLLIQQIWGDDWGHFEDFRLWAEAGGADPVPEQMSDAAKYFRTGQERH